MVYTYLARMRTGLSLRTYLLRNERSFIHWVIKNTTNQYVYSLDLKLVAKCYGGIRLFRFVLYFFALQQNEIVV